MSFGELVLLWLGLLLGLQGWWHGRVLLAVRQEVLAVRRPSPADGGS